MPTFTLSRFLILLALVLFVLSAFGVSFAAVGLVPLGLAIYMASHLVP